MAPAVLFLANERVDCRVVDISTAGIGLWSPFAHAPGQFLRINFALAPRGGVPRWHEADGVLVRATRTHGAAVLGVQFANVDDRVLRDVHAYVDGERLTTRPAIPSARCPPPSTGEFSPVGDSTAQTANDVDLRQLYLEALCEVEGRSRRGSKR